MINDSDLQPLVAGTYLTLAELLDAMPVEQWDVASLCEGSRVREVVAHLTMPARYSEDAFMAELRGDDFDFTRLSNRIAARCHATDQRTALEPPRRRVVPLDAT